MKPRVSKTEIAAYMRELIMSDKPAWQLMRDAEIMRGYQWVPVGSVPWLTLADWHEHDCVAIDGNEVRLVAIAAQRPRSGAFKRLLAAIDAAGLKPVVICPLGQMTAILERWGWVQSESGSTFADYEEQWRPPGPQEAHTGATGAGGTITPPEAAAPAGGPGSPPGGNLGGNDG